MTTGPVGQKLDGRGRCVECGERPRDPGVSLPSCLCGMVKIRFRRATKAPKRKATKKGATP